MAAASSESGELTKVDERLGPGAHQITIHTEELRDKTLGNAVKELMTKCGWHEAHERVEQKGEKVAAKDQKQWHTRRFKVNNQSSVVESRSQAEAGLKKLGLVETESGWHAVLGGKYKTLEPKNEEGAKKAAESVKETYGKPKL
ncbi:MAG: hypothetical protein Q9162_005852 [Coniocarpon cinnabarinum]